jgi:hypothetical protein
MALRSTAIDHARGWYRFDLPVFLQPAAGETMEWLPSVGAGRAVTARDGF